MVEVTEAMKRLGITQEVFQRWQEEDLEDEPGPFLMPEDVRILAQRRAEYEARSGANGTHNGNGHSPTEPVSTEKAADAAAPAEKAA